MKRVYSKRISIFLIVCLMLSVLSIAEADSFASSSKRVKYIAHRGLSARAPENTLPAFRLAAKNKGFYGVEFDVWEASYPDIRTEVTDEDGNRQVIREIQDPLLLVMHDQNIKRMCGISKDISKISRKTLNKYKIRSGKNIKKYKNLRIPTTDQTIDTIYRYSKGAVPVIELKHRLSSGALEYLLDSLEGRSAVIISFEFDAVSDTAKMARRKGISANIRTMYLRRTLASKNYASTIRKMKAAGIDCISLKYTAISKKTVRTFHKEDMEVCAWTLPDKKTSRKYEKMGVDYITANGVLF